MTEAKAYYNEIDAYAAEWLRNLISENLIARGDVDERSIVDVRPADLIGYTQCHFFAGVGVWSYSLRLAGWPDNRPVWTFSEPCQPFSQAGKGKGAADERYLRPYTHHLVRVCRPPIIFGEQVASKDGLGWLDTLQADMEAENYACAAVDTCSAGVGAPHIRQRLRVVAQRLADPKLPCTTRHGTNGREGASEAGVWGGPADCGRPDDMADATGRGQRKLRGSVESGNLRHVDGCCNPSCRMANSEGRRCDSGTGSRDFGKAKERRPVSSDCNKLGGLANASSSSGPEHEHEQGGERTPAAEDAAERERSGGLEYAERYGRQEGCGDTGEEKATRTGTTGYDLERSGSNNGPGPTNGFWRDVDWLFCRDGKWRPVEPGTFPLAYGAPSRVGRLRAYGNAIDAEATRVFIEAVMECMP
ncbi:DNA cytosine methyltransferase [Roseibium album]|uniref:DNA cytosine methyltransferase n=1 Tax=Roseibium album TaxID=311410 RepID=UPI00391D367F